MNGKGISRRKFLGYVGATAIAAPVLQGCGVQGGQDGRVTLDLWSHLAGATHEPTANVLVDRFNSEHQNVRVEHTPYPNEEFKSKVLSTAFSGGEPPDMFMNVGGEWLGQYAREDVLLDLTSWYRGRADRYPKGISAAYTINGKIYGVPWRTETTGLIYYNKDIFADNGLSDENLQTYDRWLDTCGKLKAAGVTPIAFGNKQQFPAIHYASNFIKMALGAERSYDLFAKHEGRWSDPEVVGAVRSLATLNERGYFTQGAPTEDYFVALESFLSGEAAMAITTLGETSQITASSGLDAGFAQWPEFEDGPGKSSDWIFWAECVSATKNVEDREAALDFLDAAGSAEYQRAAFEEVPSYLTSAQKALEGGSPTPLFQEVISAYQKITALLPIPDVAMPVAAAAVLQDELAGVLEGQVDAGQAMKNVDAALAQSTGQ